ncbi:MAG: PIN domain-containing protein, partial [Burkholderiaceae bacterium]
MPLPKPPAKRGSLLSPADYDSQSAPRPAARPQKTRLPSDPAPAVMNLYDGDAAASAVALKPPKTEAAAYRAPEPRAKKPRSTGPAKLFVLDTNVLMHDPTSLFRFEEHDIYLPMITLEELDGHKKGMTEVARNVRQVSRDLDALAATNASRDTSAMADGVLLNRTGRREASGRLFFQTQALNVNLPAGLPPGKADNQILGVVQALRELHPDRDVVLVSKDINMRIKARALGLPAEDYFNDKALEDGDLLYTGVLPLPADFWERHGKTMESWNQGGTTCYRIAGPLVPGLLINQFAYLEAPGAAPLYVKVTEITGTTAVLRTVKEYT